VNRPPPAEALVDVVERDWYLRRFCFFGTLAVQFFAVLAFGAVEYWSVGLLQLAAWLFLAVWCVALYRSPAVRLRRNPLYVPMLAFGALVLFQYLSGRTLYAPATRQNLLLLFCYFAFFVVLTHAADQRQSRRTLALALAAFGAAVAAFALAQDLTNSPRIYWWRELSQGGWLYGPYVNHNHYAGFINMVALLPVALVLGRVVRGDKAFLALFATLLMFASLVFSRSRGGLVAFAAELVLLGAIFAARKQMKHVLVVGVVALILAALTAAVGLAALQERFGVNWQTMAQGRLMVWKESFAAIRDRPLLGSGLGAFGILYPRYRTTPSSLNWTEAHNDYLQVLFETGIVGLALTIWFVVSLARAALPRLLDTRDPDFGVTLGAALGIFGMLVHSLFDFNMQIPANAMLFFLLCALLT
jgi:O-antigen ligase